MLDLHHLHLHHHHHYLLHLPVTWPLKVQRWCVEMHLSIELHQYHLHLLYVKLNHNYLPHSHPVHLELCFLHAYLMLVLFHHPLPHLQFRKLLHI